MSEECRNKDILESLGQNIESDLDTCSGCLKEDA